VIQLGGDVGLASGVDGLAQVRANDVQECNNKVTLGTAAAAARVRSELSSSRSHCQVPLVKLT